MRRTHSNPHRNKDVGECQKLLQPETQSEDLDETELRWKEEEGIVRKAPISSAPGPKGIP